MSKNKEESLHELMAGMKPRGKEPRNAGVLDSWIDHAEADFGIAASGRVRWLIASTVITAMLQQVVDDDNACRFSLKGGTLLQHVFGLASRATMHIIPPLIVWHRQTTCFPPKTDIVLCRGYGRCLFPEAPDKLLP